MKQLVMDTRQPTLGELWNTDIDTKCYGRLKKGEINDDVSNHQ